MFLIGVISSETEEEIVKEFFELFKTPWEFYQNSRLYDVVISTTDNNSDVPTRLLVIYGSKKTRFDCEQEISVRSQKKQAILECHEGDFPIYGKVLTFDPETKPLITVKGSSEPAGIEINTQDQKILRIGFDLFQEINFLLSSGQPQEYAHIPTLEMHISMLRHFILTHGIHLLEIPPVPAGYDFIACLTHDVDFVGIRRHKFDHTLLGFIYRALAVSLYNAIKGKISWKNFAKNCKAVLSLPFVYAGIIDDFWVQFHNYLEIEKNAGSTFFFIPSVNSPGETENGKTPKKRAAKYDIHHLKSIIDNLKLAECEIGLHGVDAWHNQDRAKKELAEISVLTNQSQIGVRIHWLYFNQVSPKILEDAGFLFDSTMGYNDAVGYKAGTTQVFRPLGARKLLEIPLHIQDTALFYPSRMGLSEEQAMRLCSDLLSIASQYGGVLTLNWHHRSLAPERLWKDFYIRLLDNINKQRVWFGKASEIVQWFQKRRDVTFEDIQRSGEKMRIVFGNTEKEIQLPMIIRIHHPKII